MKPILASLRKTAAVILAVVILNTVIACSPTAVTTTTTVTGTSGNPVVSSVTGGSTIVTTTVTVTPLSSSGALDFVAAVNKVLPSVVIIEDEQTVQGPFGQTQTAQAAGTGWVLNSNGVIVTNAHVVYNATNIKITLADGRVFPSVDAQSDINNDLAVIKIAANNLTPASIGDSANLQLGQMVAAVGNSLDMGVRVTGGLVSRLNNSATYSIDGQTNVTMDGLIETDATINPGNSGGVLIDISGNVMGITSSGLSGPTTDVTGFGYAININKAMPIINSLASKLPQ